jgi:hypothetical protein
MVKTVMHKNVKVIWNPNNDNNDKDANSKADPSVFWGLTGSYSGNYGAPDGFCFDVLCTYDGGWGVTPLMDLNETRDTTN